MLISGQVVDAAVARLVGYGVILRAEEDRILVLITETAPTADAQRAVMSNLASGQVVKVRIKQFVEKDKLYMGSMKSV